MKITKSLTTTNAYEESFTVTDELISAFKDTLTGTDKSFAEDPDITDIDFISEMQEELWEFAWKQYHVEGNTDLTEYEETDTVLHGEFEGYEIND